MARQSLSFGTSETLIDRVRAEEREAWVCLCEIYTPLVYGWARKSRLQASDAEDIVQDVFRRVAKGLKNFSYDGPHRTFRGWLWTITRNVIRDFVRDRDARVGNAEGGTAAMRKLAEAPDWIDDEEVAEPELDASEESAVLRRALKLVQNDFSEKTWNAFWRFAIDGHESEVIAKELDMSTNGVRQAKFRVLARLREVLG